VTYEFLKHPPRWDDEKGVKAFVATILEGVKEGFIGPFSISVSKYLDALDRECRNECYKDWPKQREREAVEAAKRGNLKSLVDMLRPLESGAVDLTPTTEFLTGVKVATVPHDPGAVTLAPETWTLITEFLTGKRNLHNGKLRGVRDPRTGKLKRGGRPKMSKEERRAHTPIHVAAREFPAIRDILKQWYPEQSKKVIRERAEKIAAERNHIKFETLKDYCERSKDDRHRI
jgi:hypothetical protein